MPRSYEFGRFRLDAAERRLLRDGEAVPLAPKAFDTLLILARNPGRLLSKEHLLQQLWPETFVEEANLSNNISALRKALGDDGKDGAWIETVPRHGYRFVAEVKEVEAAAATVSGEGTGSPPVVEEKRPPASQTRRLLLALAVAFALALAAWWAARRLTQDSAPAVRSVAVLPFLPLGSGGQPDDLGLGMADALITRLGALPRPIVRPTSAVREYGNPNRDALAAGRALGVDAVLEGHVQRSGGRVRVTARLLRVSDGTSLWADTFDEDLGEVFAIQDRIAFRMARTLTGRLTPAEERRLTMPAPRSDAYALFLRGLEFADKANPRDQHEAIDALEKAVQLDPAFAMAHARLADAYLVGYSNLPPQERPRRASEEAKKALALSPDLAEAHAALAMVASHDFRWEEAESEFRLALDLNPNSAPVRGRHASHLCQWGRTEECIGENQREIELDPHSLDAHTRLGDALVLARRFEDARRELETTLKLHPDAQGVHTYLARAYEGLGRLDDAVREAQRAADLGSATSKAHLARLWARQGRMDEARGMRLQFERAVSQGQPMSYLLAQTQSALGDNDGAFRSLDRALRDGDPRIAQLKTLYLWDGLRGDGRRADLLGRIGLDAKDRMTEQ